MNNQDKNYMQGMQDGLELYGRVCGKQSSCEECMVGQLKGNAVSCQEFMKQFPMKMLSFLTEMDSGDYSYFDEYVTRFPNCNLPIEDLSQIVCRKAIFEGYVECDSEDCLECWKEQYVTDVTMSDEDIEVEREFKNEENASGKKDDNLRKITNMFDEDY